MSLSTQELEFWPELSIGSTHDYPGYPECRCGLKHLITETIISTGMPMAIRMIDLFYQESVEKRPVIGEVTFTVEPNEDQFEILGVINASYEYVQDWIPAPPAVDTIECVEDTVTFKFWVWNDSESSTDFLLRSGWNQKTKQCEISGSGKWVALYWKYGTLKADTFDSKSNAEDFLEQGSEDNDLSPVQVIERRQDV